MRALMDAVRASLHKRAHTLERGHWGAHVSYLGLVSYESHGLYGKAALVMLVFVLVMAWAGIEVEE